MCTGFRLKAENGSVVYARTMEWGAFDLKSQVTLIPKGHVFRGTTTEGANGKEWAAKYNVLALDFLGTDWLADGINEAGLAVGMFYHPGFAEYPDYDPVERKNTIAAVEMVGYLLTRYASLQEVKEGLKGVQAIGVGEAILGTPDPAHWMVTEASGASIVIEYAHGELQVFDNPLGVITNAPTYDWHMINLRNYINLSSVALPTRHIDELDFAPLGAGSGMIGLPGDNTPPSRFVRAVAMTHTTRPIPNAHEAVYEALRILDNFNLPLGGAEGSDQDGDTMAMRSSTIWTSVWDVENRTLYYHTQHNRRVRKVSLADVTFAEGALKRIPLDREKEQDVEDVSALLA